MKATKGLAILGLAFAISFTGPAFAQDKGFFIGASIGQTDVDEEIVNQQVIDAGGNVDGEDTAWKIYGGYMFNRHFGVEVSYIDAGEVSYSGTFAGLPVTGGKVELSAWNVSALGVLPISEQFSIFGKVGLFKWEAQYSDTTGGIPFSADDDGTDASFGVGLAWNFTRNLALRAEYEFFKTDEADVNLLSLGVVWKF